MSEATTPPVEGTPPPVDTPPVGETPPSGLPSENTTPDYSGFDMSDAMKEKFKDGKLNGRFSSMDDVLEKLKEAEDFKAQTIRELKGTEQVQETNVAQETVVLAMMPEFVANGMKLTTEMETKLTEGITDDKDRKIAIFEFRDKARGIADRTNSVYGAVGGKENFDTIHAWGKENLSVEHQKVFTEDVNGSNEASLIAVEWLNDKYQKAVKEGTVTPRIEGQPHNAGIRAYADRKELYKDKDYIDSPAGRRDSAAKKNYQARLRATPDAIIYGNR